MTVTGGQDDGFQFTILSYNILADNLMQAQPALYTFTPLSTPCTYLVILLSSKDKICIETFVET